MPSLNPVWDLPTRVFHWLIVLCVLLSWWSGEQGDFERHAWVGYTAIVLVVFRVIWGFVGSRHSRFRDFVRGPTVTLAYLKGKHASGVGHSPLAAWSVLTLLGLLLIQATSGLFNSDDLMFDGPFHYWASVEFRDAMGVVHEFTFYLLLGFIALHLLAVAYYQWLKKVPLIQVMIRGVAPGRVGEQGPAPVWLAMLVIVLLAGLLWGAISLAPQPQMLW